MTSREKGFNDKMSKVGHQYMILDFGKWREVKKGVIVNSNWLRWEDGRDIGMACPGKWKENKTVCTPHMGDARVKLEPKVVVPVAGLFIC